MRLTILVALTLSTVPSAHASGGEGFTFEYDFGLGTTFLPGDTRVGPSLDSFGVGYFLSPSTSIMARASGTAYLQRARLGQAAATNFITKGLAYYGPQVQIYLTDELFVAGGPGFLTLGPPRLTGLLLSLVAADTDTDIYAGFGGGARAGYVFWNKPRRANLRAGIEGLFATIEGETLYGVSLNVGVQVW